MLPILRIEIAFISPPNGIQELSYFTQQCNSLDGVPSWDINVGADVNKIHIRKQRDNRVFSTVAQKEIFKICVTYDDFVESLKNYCENALDKTLLS